MIEQTNIQTQQRASEYKKFFTNFETDMEQRQKNHVKAALAQEV
jgi:hypothetical protein